MWTLAPRLIPSLHRDNVGAVSRTPLRCLIAAVSGVLAAVSFEPVDLPLLLPLAVAGLTLAVPAPEQARTSRAALVGGCFGVGFMALHVGWISVLGLDVAVGLVLLQASFFLLLGAGLSLVRGLPAWPVCAAVVWVGVELLRGVVPWGGFPWGSLAYATVDTPLAPSVALAGTAGTSLLVALLGTTLAWSALQLRTRAVQAIGGVVIVAALAYAAGAAAGVAPWREAEPDAETVRVAAVQGDVPGEGMEAFAERRAVLDNHVRETHELAERVRAASAPRPDLVLWPENSTDIDPYLDDSVRRDIQDAVDDIGVPVLVGGMISGDEPGDVENQSIVWQPGAGPVDHYSKRHPVPFGEYIPMRDLLAQYFERLDQIPRDMVPGPEPGNLEVGGADLGVVICFEVAYDGLVRDVVRGGAGMLVVPTNNATYMGTGQVEQQFAISRLRALETDRYVAVVATNGISGLVAPDGTVVEQLPTRRPGVWEAEVELSDTMTPAMRWGHLLRWGLGGVALLLVLVGAASRRRRSDRTTTAEPTTEGVRLLEPETVPAEGERHG